MKIRARRCPKSRKSGSGGGRETLFLTCRAMSYHFLEEFGQSWRQDAQSYTQDAPRCCQDGCLGRNLCHLGEILVPSWEVLGGFGEPFGGVFGHRRECKIEQHYNVFGIFSDFGGVLAAMFFKVVRRWRQEGSKIQDFRPSRRSGWPSWRQEGSNFFSKTRPESLGRERLGSGRVDRRRRRGR